MKTLVIGGTLFIGRRLVAQLLRAGHEVAVLHRNAGRALPPGVEGLLADRNDSSAVRRALSGRTFDVVFDNVYDWERGTTSAQVEATARACAGVGKFVYMSSVAAYGRGLDHVEDDPLAPEGEPDPYCRNKAMSERALLAMGIPVVTFRPPYVYGPENPFYREAFFFDRFRDGRAVILPGDGSRLMQFVYVDDLVRAQIAAMTKGEGAFNIGDARPVTQREAVEALARAAGVEPRIVPVDRARIRAAGGNPMGEPLYFGQYFDMPAITETMGRAERELGVKPTPFEEGLRATYEWYAAQPRRCIDYAFEDRLL